MPIIHMQAPEGMTSFSHQGHPQPIGRDGILQIDDRHAPDYAAHGFTLADEPRRTAAGLAADRVFAADPRPDAREAPAAAPASELSPGTVAFLNRLSATPGSLDRLAAMLEREAEGAPDPRAVPIVPSPPAPLVEAPSQPAPPSPDAKLTDAQIEAMSKAQLVAWCKAREIPIDSPIDVDVLRMKVKHAVAQD